ncbi:UNVERIFIED_CONTAM: hypothetical protein Sindi_1148800 [Sesamum indicum]
MFVSAGSADKGKEFFLSKILERTDEIRSHYEGVLRNDFTDEELAEMILLMPVFILYFLEMVGDEEMEICFFLLLGMSGAVFLAAISLCFSGCYGSSDGSSKPRAHGCDSEPPVLVPSWFSKQKETETDAAVISYVNFMKLLIESPKDIKELPEKVVLASNLGSSEAVTYFDSPWNAIALLAAMFHLCLSFLQTYYRIHPAKDKNDRNRARDMLN